MPLTKFISRLFGTQSAQPKPKISRVKPVVRNLVQHLQLAAAKDLTNRPGKLPFKHRRALPFRVHIKRAEIPQGLLRKDAMIPDPWWSPFDIERDAPVIGNLCNGEQLLDRNEFSIELRNGETIKHNREVRLGNNGKRYKLFFAETLDGKSILFDDVPQQQLPLYFPKPLNDSSVILVEGAKAARALAECGHHSAGTLTGALGTPSLAALERLAHVKTVYLWPDNDDVGVRHMQRIAEKLHAAGQKNIKIIRWRAPQRGRGQIYFLTRYLIKSDSAL